MQRYQCSGCRRTFSDRTFAADFRQHKPGINQAFAELRREGVGLRLAARQLGVSFNTALARSQWLAAQSKVCNQARTPRTRGKKG
ncbi:IS1 family transposase [Paraburkholderia fungorum]|uniref:IS1 family transposase n=1 Tax=Paraburkholderia fungorum TaxID=134537 RepID=UPI0011B2433B|nr:IS1 family transposase [Paraburkholderia fungorum]